MSDAARKMNDSWPAGRSSLIAQWHLSKAVTPGATTGVHQATVIELAQQTQNQIYLLHALESRTKKLMGFYSQTWPTKAGQLTMKL